MLEVADAKLILDALEEAQVKVVTFLPESRLKPLYTLLLEQDKFEVIPVPNESTGVCIAAGAWIGGKRSVMIMENSGLRVASEALARLGLPLQLPVVLLMSYRGNL
jgi:sulfopyruvate decarboxylase subunit alpha